MAAEHQVVFEAFMSWLYTGILYTDSVIVPGSTQYNEKTDVALSLFELARIWIFGDWASIPGLQNKAIEAMHRKILQTWSYQIGLADPVYENTVAAAPLRRFVVEFCASTYWDKPTRGRAIDGETNVEFFRDLCKEMMELRIEEQLRLDESACAIRKDVWTRLDLSNFHVSPANDRNGTDANIGDQAQAVEERSS